MRRYIKANVLATNARIWSQTGLRSAKMMDNEMCLRWHQEIHIAQHHPANWMVKDSLELKFCDCREATIRHHKSFMLGFNNSKKSSMI